MSWLRGKKTYLIGILMFAIEGLRAIGVLDAETVAAIYKILAALGLMTLRAAIGKT